MNCLKNIVVLTVTFLYLIHLTHSQVVPLSQQQNRSPTPPTVASVGGSYLVEFNTDDKGKPLDTLSGNSSTSNSNAANTNSNTNSNTANTNNNASANKEGAVTNPNTNTQDNTSSSNTVEENQLSAQPTTDAIPPPQTPITNQLNVANYHEFEVERHPCIKSLLANPFDYKTNMTVTDQINFYQSLCQEKGPYTKYTEYIRANTESCKTIGFDYQKALDLIINSLEMSCVQDEEEKYCYNTYVLYNTSMNQTTVQTNFWNSLQKLCTEKSSLTTCEQYMVYSLIRADAIVDFNYRIVVYDEANGYLETHLIANDANARNVLLKCQPMIKNERVIHQFPEYVVLSGVNHKNYLVSPLIYFYIMILYLFLR